MKSTSTKWDTPSRASYIISSLYFTLSDRFFFLPEIPHLVRSRCYVACAGYTSCAITRGRKTTLKYAKTWKCRAQMSQRVVSQWNGIKLRRHKYLHFVGITIYLEGVLENICSQLFEARPWKIFASKGYLTLHPTPLSVQEQEGKG